MGEAVRTACANRCTRPRLDLQVHHAISGKGQQLADKVAVRPLLDQLDQGHPVIGHRRLLLQVQLRNRTLAEDRR